MSGQQPGPTIELMKLWEKTSAKTGNVYLVGRLSGARVIVLRNTRKTSDADHDWVVMLSQADAPKPQPAEAAPAQPQPRLPLPRPYGRDYAARQSRPEDRLKKPVGPGKTVLLDDPVPF